MAEVLQTILDGTSADDAMLLRNALLGKPTDFSGDGVISDEDLLSDKWREGASPYKNLMNRKPYEKQKYMLQVELLKLQSWI